MGTSAKGTFHLIQVEERIFISTNYFQELTHYFPNIIFTLHFVGPELSDQNNQ